MYSNALRKLGLKPGSSREQVKAAYLRLAKQHHPDAVAKDLKSAAEGRFKEISQAYKVLSQTGQGMRDRAPPSTGVKTSQARLLVAIPFFFLVASTVAGGVMCAAKSYQRARKDSPSPHPFLP